MKMIKPLLILAVLTGFVIVALGGLIELFASPLVVERPIKSCADPTTLSVSTSAWTQAPANSNCASRTVVVVSNPSTNNEAIAAYTENSTTASVAITIRPIEISVGSILTIHLQDNDYLFLVSLHTVAENVHIQEFRQR